MAAALVAVDYIAGQKYLRHLVVVFDKMLVIDIHKLALADGGGRLLFGYGPGLMLEPQLGGADGDGPRCDQHDLSARVLYIGQYAAEFFDLTYIDHACIVCDRACAHLDDDAAGVLKAVHLSCSSQIFHTSGR